MRLIFLFIWAIVLPSFASAQAVYQYDAHGRLIKAGEGGANATCYAYDKADNRTTVTTGGTCTSGGSRQAPTANTDYGYMLYFEYMGMIFAASDGTVNVLANDTDPDLPNDTLKVVSVSGSPYFSVSNNGTRIYFDGFSAPDGGYSATYVMKDSTYNTSSATVYVTKVTEPCEFFC